MLVLSTLIFSRVWHYPPLSLSLFPLQRLGLPFRSCCLLAHLEIDPAITRNRGDLRGRPEPDDETFQGSPPCRARIRCSLRSRGSIGIDAPDETRARFDVRVSSGRKKSIRRRLRATRLGRPIYSILSVQLYLAVTMSIRK